MRTEFFSAARRVKKKCLEKKVGRGGKKLEAVPWTIFLVVFLKSRQRPVPWTITVLRRAHAPSGLHRYGHPLFFFLKHLLKKKDKWKNSKSQRETKRKRKKIRGKTVGKKGKVFIHFFRPPISGRPQTNTMRMINAHARVSDDEEISMRSTKNDSSHRLFFLPFVR